MKTYKEGDKLILKVFGNGGTVFFADKDEESTNGIQVIEVTITKIKPTH